MFFRHKTSLTKDIYHNFVDDLVLILRNLERLSRVDISAGRCGDIFRLLFFFTDLLS